MSDAASARRASHLSMLVVCLIWGANYSITKSALAYLPPIPFSAIRFTLGSLMLVALSRSVSEPRAIPTRTRWWLIGVGIVGNTLNPIAFTSGLSLTTATNSALVFASLPMVVALLGMLFRIETPTPRLLTGIALGTVGVVLVVTARGLSFSSATLRGDLLSVLAMLLWALFTVGVRYAGQGLGAIRVTMMTSVAGTPGLVLLALPQMRSVHWHSLGPAVWGALLFATVMSSVVAFILWNRSVQVLGGSRTSLYNCLTPVFAGLIAWGLLGERPLASQGVGALFVIAGVLVSHLPARNGS